MLQALAVLAVGAAAVSFVAGTGVYLSIRFTQQRRGRPGEPRPPSGAAADPKASPGP